MLNIKISDLTCRILKYQGLALPMEFQVLIAQIVKFGMMNTEPFFAEYFKTSRSEMQNIEISRFVGQKLIF